MPIYQPSKLHRLGVRAKKHFSQIFLIDQNILEKICLAADVRANDSILEIGPGPGAITEKLLEKGANVFAIEKDGEMVEKLRHLQHEHLKVQWADALTFSFTDLPEGTKIVASLPYHIATPLIERFVRCYPKISSLTVIVQREVGQRITAKTNSSHYSSFSLFLQAYSTPKYCFTIKPTSFFPSPSVHSCLIHMSLQPFPFSFSEETFFQMTRTAFHQRRKMLRSSLKKLYPQDVLEKSFSKTKIAATARPQELSLQDFARLLIECEDACKNKKSI